MTLVRAAFFLTLAALAGCAGNLGYVAAENEDAYGYTEVALSEQSYRIAYNGKSMLRNERLADYTIRRAAEVTLVSGYDWFRIAGSTESVGHVSADNTPALIPAQVVAKGGDFSLRRQALAKTNRLRADINADAPEASLSSIAIDIVMGQGKVPAEALVFDARRVPGVVETI